MNKFHLLKTFLNIYYLNTSLKVKFGCSLCHRKLKHAFITILPRPVNGYDLFKTTGTISVFTWNFIVHFFMFEGNDTHTFTCNFL